VNALDFVIIAALLAAAFGGWRLGFIARVFAWTGVAVALVIGIRYVPRVVTAFGGTSADDRVTVALLFLVLVATLGQAIGLGVGLIVHRYSTNTDPLPRWDRVAGAIVGTVGVIALVWMTIPSLATAKGWPARLARHSAVVAFIDELAPEQPAQFEAWGRAISDAPYPSVLGRLDDPPNPGVPPDFAIPPEVDQFVRQSVVKVSGNACDQMQEGSGWVTESGLVVTNAHVVAGENGTVVEAADGTEYDATVVAFDPVRDLAVLRVPPNFDVPGLKPGTGREGDVGAVYGHPGGGGLRAESALVGDRIAAVGTDIYRTGRSQRDVFVLASSLLPGDSGGPLVNTSGEVIGVAFAIDSGQKGTSYAITTDGEVLALLDSIPADFGPVDTGRCLVE
jgi:S1-C subfamily serine protease